MKKRLKRFIQYAMLIFAVLTVVMWLNRFYPILNGTFSPDLNDPLDVIMLYSDPWAELIAPLIVNVFIIAPVVGTFVSLIVSIFSKPRDTESAPHDVQTKQPTWAAIILGVLGVGLIGSCYSSSKPMTSGLATITPVSSITPVPTPPPVDQWLKLSNEEVTLTYPATWELVRNESDGVAFGGTDFFFAFYWFDEESSTAFFFHADGQPKEISAGAREAIEQDALTSIQGLEGDIIESKYFKRTTIGSFKLVGATGYEAKVRGYKLFDQVNSVHTFLPYFVCGEYRGCKLIYANSGEAPMSVDDWQVVEKVISSVEFSDNKLIRATMEASPVAGFQEFSNDSVSFFFPSDWAIERNTERGVTTRGANEIFNLEWQSTDYQTSTIFEAELDPASKQSMTDKLEKQVQSMLEARGGTVTSIEPIEKKVIGQYQVFIQTAFIVTVELKQEGEIGSFAMIPSAACGSQRVCTLMYGRIGSNQLSDEDWTRLEQIAGTITFITDKGD